MKLILCVIISVAVLPATSAEKRTKRFLPVFDWLATGGRCSGCPRACSEDLAVAAGYCCGCARVSDRLPINCRYFPGSCPSDGRKLCRDYDYMLDCCCP